MEQEVFSLTFEWAKLKVPCSSQLYKIPDKIYDISFSDASPDVLYIRTGDDKILSLDLRRRASVSKIAINGVELQSEGGLLCHNNILYIDTEDTIYKCTTGGKYLSSLDNDGGWALATKKDGKLYCTSIDNERSLGVIDNDTMTLVSTISLRHNVNDIAISRDDRLHVATNKGICVYKADGSYTGVMYLRGEMCYSIASTSNGYAVGLKGKVAIVSSDLASTHYITLANMSWCYVRCSPVDDTLAVVDCAYGRFTLLPREVYRPPFSLSVLCKSTLLSHPDVLLSTFLPPIIYRQFKQHISMNY